MDAGGVFAPVGAESAFGAAEVAEARVGLLVTLLLGSAQAGEDVGGVLGRALGVTADLLGSVDALVARRPGSWEAVSWSLLHSLAPALRDGSVGLVVHGDPALPAVALRWGAQVDARPVRLAAGRDDRAGGGPSRHGQRVPREVPDQDHRSVRPARPLRVVRSGPGVRGVPHAVAILRAAELLARVGGEPYARLRDRLEALGYRGASDHHSRRYGTSFGAIRAECRDYQRRRHRPAGLDPAAGVRELLDDNTAHEDGVSVVVVREWRYAGRGHLSVDAAARARLAAHGGERACCRRRAPTPAR